MTSNRRPFTYLAALFTILLLPYSVSAQSASEADQSFVDKLVEKMALKHQVSAAPEEIRAQFEQNPLQLPPETNEQMLEQFDKAYATDLLLQDFKTAIQKEITGQHRQELSQWLGNDQTKSITESQQFYYTLQGKRQRVITRYEMDQNPPSDQRINLISTLTDTTSVAESSVESSVIILKSVIRASSQLSTQRNFSDAQINAFANNFRTQLQAQAGDQLNRQQLVMYHHVQDETLQQYISFWGTDTGQQLDNAISQSLQAAYRQAAERFLQSIN